MTKSDTNKLTRQQIARLNEAFAQGYARRSRNMMIVAVAVAIVALAVGVIAGDMFLSLVVVVLGLWAIAFMPLISTYVTLMRAYGPGMELLAGMLSGAYTQKRRLTAYPKKPLFVGLGWFKREEHEIAWANDGVQCRSFIYTFRHPFENRYDRKKLRVHELVFEKNMPHVLIRSKESGILGKLDEHIPMSERVRVESQFEKRFDVYSHRRTATEALTLLGPNVLATILDFGEGYDTEIVGNRVYVYSDADELSAEQLDEELQYVSRLIGALNHKLKTFRFVLPNDSYPFMTSQPSAGTAHIGDARLNGGIFFAVGYAVFQSGKLALRWDELDSQERALNIGIITVCFIVIVVFLVLRRRKR